MSDGARILIADDEPLYLRTTAELLRKAGYDCTCAPDGKTAIQALRENSFDLVLSDLNMPGNLKLELLKAGREQWPDVPVIVITGAPSLPSAIESVRLGITDYLLKPVKYEDLLASVKRALAKGRTTSNGQAAVNGQQTTTGGLPGLIGESAVMQELFDIIHRVAATDANVLITGESGTGKEVVASAIHTLSQRSKANFQVIDCTAVPESLFESVLFGHARGAFTGAIRDQVGLLSQADGGSVFFDEIGELPAPQQAKLLRVIQQRTFTPLGKTTPVSVDTRFLCATNRDLEVEVNAGRFRRDLFYRLAVIHIQLPPLRERGDDVVLLAQHFLGTLQGPEQRVSGFTDEAVQVLRCYAWPGNIRELRNAVEHGLAFTRDTAVNASDLPLSVQHGATSASCTTGPEVQPTTRDEAVSAAEREFLISLLRENAGNVAHSARQAGLSRQGLHKMLKRHQINPDDFRK